MHKACWISGDAAQIAEFTKRYLRLMANDKNGRLVYLAESAWTLQMAEENFPKLKFSFTAEF